MEKPSVVPAKPPANIIQADAAAFKELVQKLTCARGGSARQKAAIAPRRSPFKLQERRKHTVRDLEIIQLGMENSPGMTRSISLEKGPLTPLGCDSVSSERVGTESPPVLLTLFPLTNSPKKE